MLPGLDPVREQITGSADQLGPDAFTSYIEEQVDRLELDGGFATIILHLPLLEWLGEQNLASILNKLSTTQAWVAPCDEVAAHILSHPTTFERGATLDQTTWAT